MSKKLLVAGVMLALVATIVGGVAVSTASAQSMTLCQTVTALVAAGVIAPDKVVAANAAAGCTANTTSTTASTVTTTTFTRSLTVGSTGPDVVALQSWLISQGYSIPAGATGYFGAQTRAAVIAYQLAKGITPAVGYFGPITRASVMTSVTTTTTTTTTGTTGTTPVCPAGYTCAATVACPVGFTCTSNTTGGALVGGAGSATFSTTTTNIESTVNEGAVNTKVLGFKVEASDSDVSVTNLKVTLKNTVTGVASTRIDRYLDSVSVYMGSTKVGSADIADFTKDGTTYSKSIALSDAVVREGTANKATFYVTVDVLSSIDSANRDDADTVVTVSNIRYVDGSGVNTTDTASITETIGYSTLAASGDVKVAVTKGTDIPTRNVEVSDTSATDNVLMLEFKVKATGSDVSFDTLSVNLATTTSKATDIVSQLVLKVVGDSDPLASIDGSDVLATSTFDLDSTYTIAAGETKTFRVYADINDQTNFANGSSLKVSFTGSTGFSPEDSNGDVVDATGSAAGGVQTFVISGAIVSYVSQSYSASEVDNSIEGRIGLTFTVKALGDSDVTITEDQGTSEGADAGSAGDGVVVYTVDGSSSVTSAIISPVPSSAESSVDGNFTVTSGDEKTYKLLVGYTTSSGQVRLNITSVDGTTVSNIRTPYN